MIFNRSNNLGPVVGQINGKDIYANQLLRKGYNWQNGYGTPSDGQDTNKNGGPIRKLIGKSKDLIIYWSRSGSTELLASMIEKETNADIFQIELQKLYPANYQKTLNRANNERLSHQPPKVIQDLPDISKYERVFIGFQTWAMTLSQPVQGFLEEYGNQFNKKIIAPFETEGGYGAGDSINVMKQLITQNGGPDNKFTKPLIVDGNKVDKAKSQVDMWLKEIVAAFFVS